MGIKKVNLPSLFNKTCIQNPKTMSFRCHNPQNDPFFKTLNSVFFEPDSDSGAGESWWSDSSPATSFSTDIDLFVGDDVAVAGDDVEAVIRGAHSSDRLFFDCDETRSVVEAEGKIKDETKSFQEHDLVVEMDSLDPYRDFRRSMEEVVESHGEKDWEELEEMLTWYMTVNDKRNHCYIIAAFTNLLAEIVDRI